MIKRYGLYLLSALLVAGCGSDNGKSDSGLRDGSFDLRTDVVTTTEVGHLPDLAMDMGNADLGPGPLDMATEALDTSAGAVDAADTMMAMDGADAADAADAADVAIGDAMITEAGGEASSGTLFVAYLSGDQQVPPLTTFASGNALFVLSPDRTRLTYTLSHNVENPVAAHIHFAAAKENGPVVYPLVPLGTTMTGTLFISAADADNLERGMLYVNVHSTLHPDGEIRGQILRPGDTLWVASLTGQQETPPVGSSATGTAAVIVNADKSMLRYHVSINGLTPISAHIHRGIAGIAGPVVHPLTPVAGIMDGTIAITATDVQDLVDGHLYINAHTVANPNGEIRGQLISPSEVLYSAVLNGQNVSPAVTTTATGGAQFIVDPGAKSMRYEATFTGLVATAAAIRSGIAGTNGAVIYALTVNPAGTSAKGRLSVTQADITAMDADNYYINVSTTANPDGEIRGQIAKR